MTRSGAGWLFVTLAAPGCTIWNRVGDLTMISTRNVDMSVEYVELATYQKAKVRAKGDALEAAIDEVVKKVPGGEFATNCKLYVSMNGNKVKVEADVWGRAPATGTPSAIPVGSTVTWKAGGVVRRGKVIGIGPGGATIEAEPPEHGLGSMLQVSDRTVVVPTSELTVITPEAPAEQSAP